MRTNLKLVQARMFRMVCAVALGMDSSFSLATAAKDSADTAETSVPWSQIGAKAGAEYQGDGLAVSPTAAGARLRCVFQRLEGEATRDGLWLTSTVEGSQTGRFSVMPTAVGRVGEAFGVPASAGGASESFQRSGLTAAEPAKAQSMQLKGSAPASGAVVGALANHFCKRGTCSPFGDWQCCAPQFLLHGSG